VEEDTRLAVSAALQLVAARPTDLQFRCALDAGIIVAGPLGPDPTGAVPATATRMLAHAPLNSVIASEIVRRLSAGSFEYEPCFLGDGQDPARPSYWRVLEPRRGWRRSSPTESVQLLGREPELEKLHHCWQQVAAGASKIALITGEAGIGKSALLATLRNRLAGNESSWIQAGCLPETRRATLAPVREAMRELACGYGNFGQIREADRHAMEVFLGIAGVSGAGPGGKAVGPQERLLELLIGTISAAATLRPLALVFEDLHWADEATRAFLAMLGLRLADVAGVLLVCTSRQSITSVFDPDGIGLELTIERLADCDVKRMLAASDFAGRLPPDTHQLIAERSDGIPLFAVELARLWAQRATATLSEDLLAGPSSLNATLAARLDALGDLKPLAQAAAVLGNDIDVRVLAAALEMDAGNLGLRLDRLAESGIVARHSPYRHDRYRFSHSLLRDAAINSLPEARRRILHGKIAEALTIECLERADVNPEVVADHFERAGDARRAFIWWRRAAERAIDIACSHSAAASLQRALAAKSGQCEAFTELEEIEVLKLLGVQLTQLRGSAAPETFTTYRRALDLVTKVPSVRPELRFDLIWGLDACHLVRGEVRQALALGEGLLAAAAEQASDERVMLAQRMHAVAKLLSGKIEEAIDLYSMVLARYDQAHHGALRFGYASDQGAVAHAHLAWASAISGCPNEARLHGHSALKLAGRLDHAHTSAHVVCVLATAAQILGDTGAASALSVAGDALGKRHDFPYWSAWAGLVLGWAQGCRTPEKGARLIAEAIDAYRSTGAAQALPYGYLLLGHTLLKAGQTPRALAALERASLLGEQCELELYAAEILRLRAQAEARLGSPPGRVVALIEQAIQVARKQGALTFAARAERTAQGLFGKHSNNVQGLVCARELVGPPTSSLPATLGSHLGPTRSNVQFQSVHRSDVSISRPPTLDH
jgi:tetratricopeptide (TPR) repeat protein